MVLHRVAGTYAERCNPAEADAVVAIVRELLGRAEPPSRGRGVPEPAAAGPDRGPAGRGGRGRPGVRQAAGGGPGAVGGGVVGRAVREEPGERAGGRAGRDRHQHDVRAGGGREVLPPVRAAGHARRGAAAERAGDAGAGPGPPGEQHPGRGVPVAAGRARGAAGGRGVAAVRVPEVRRLGGAGGDAARREGRETRYPSALADAGGGPGWPAGVGRRLLGQRRVLRRPGPAGVGRRRAGRRVPVRGGRRRGRLGRVPHRRAGRAGVAADAGVVAAPVPRPRGRAEAVAAAGAR